MLPEYGATTTAGYRTASVHGPCVLQAKEVNVPGDPSSAAFLVCAALLKSGSSLQIEDVSLNTARIGFVRTLERMGADISVQRTGIAGKEPYGIISVRYSDELRGCEVPAEKLASVIDEVPVLSLVAAHAKGVTVFRHVNELKIKESNRLAAIIEGLDQLGIQAWIDGDDLYIEGRPDCAQPSDLVFDAHNDHRLAMTWSLVGLCGSSSVHIIGFESVAISYPTFLETIRGLTA
jgi:3-phosphoshikimate 1-carboxyvinyltransferase